MDIWDVYGIEFSAKVLQWGHFYLDGAEKAKLKREI